MREAVIVSTARTPIGKAYRGAFNNTYGASLAGHSIAAAVERAGVDPAEIDDVVFGGRLVFGQPAILWAALTLALLTLPVVIVTTSEALRAVPVNAREASLALGATRWQTVWKVVLPQCTAGVMTGAILAVSRGAGEVAPIMFTGAAYFLPTLPTQLNDQFMELGYHIYVMSTQSPNVEETKPILFATVFVLLALTFALNATAIGIRSRFRQSIRPSDA